MTTEIETYKKPVNVEYHVFTHNKDEYFYDDEEAAMKLAAEWAVEYGSVRLYKNTEWDEFDGIFLDGDVIFRVGEYPE